MRSRLILFLFIFPIISWSQLIENSGCNAFTEEPFFNQEFIRQNGIKAINGEIRTKGNLEVIKDAKLVTRYEFDKQGKLEKQLGSFNTSGTKDTTFISYFYDDSLNLITKRTNDAYGFFSYSFTFDKENRVLSKIYSREENIGKDRYNFMLGKQYTIVKETYSYIETDTSLIKSIYNNHDRVYQKTSYFYNEHGLLASEQNQYVINKKKSNTLYEFTDKGLVSQKTHWRDLKNMDDFEKWEYKYDDHGNLTYLDYYKGNEHVTHQEVLYDNATFMLKALLVQDVASNFITIIKFTTEYY